MKRSLRLVLSAVGAFVLSQCGTVHSIDRGNAQAWNEGLVWRPASGSPKDFVPMDFKGPLVTSGGKGEWVTDPQDGYRFYVSAAGTKKFPPGVLRAEAIKATNALTRAEQATGNTLKTVFFPVSGLFWIVTNDHSCGGGGGEGGSTSSSSSSSDSFADPSDTSSSSRCCHDRNRDCKCDTGGGGHHGK